jgi:hypothetical protein
MADNNIQVPENDRTVRLSEVDFSPRNYVDANVSVPARGWMAKTSRNGGKLVSQTGVAQGTGAAPTHLRVVRSETNPGEFVLVPTNEESTDHIAVQWIDQGRFAKFHFGKLLALKKMQIPKGTRMVATLFPARDSQYGNVVGVILNEVEFVAVETKSKGKTDVNPKAEAKTEPEQEPPASA